MDPIALVSQSIPAYTSTNAIGEHVKEEFRNKFDAILVNSYHDASQIWRFQDCDKFQSSDQTCTIRCFCDPIELATACSIAPHTNAGIVVLDAVQERGKVYANSFIINAGQNACQAEMDALINNAMTNIVHTIHSYANQLRPTLTPSHYIDYHHNLHIALNDPYVHVHFALFFKFTACVR